MKPAKNEDLVGCFRTEVNKLYLQAKCSFWSVLVNKVLLKQAHPFGYLLSMAAFALQWQS